MSNELPEDMVEGKTDSRGRLYLGTEYKDSTVKVAIIEVEDNE